MGQSSRTPSGGGSKRLAVGFAALLVAGGIVMAVTGVGRIHVAERTPPSPDTAEPVDVAHVVARSAPLSVPSLDYSLDSVATGSQPVPRVFLTTVPEVLNTTEQADQRKDLFFKTILPLVLQANQDIQRDRRKLLALRERARDSGALPAADRLWLIVLGERYGLSPDQSTIKALTARVDIVPPSLALAQAAKESGWGRSRFVRDGNALFGQWTWSDADDGIVPDARQEGKTHRVRAFADLMASVQAYVMNLNSHRAYREFRAMRADMRRRGQPVDGKALAGTLHRYSELGTEYTDRLKAMIDFNGLSALDAARLAADGG